MRGNYGNDLFAAEDTKSPNAESVAASSLPAESSPLKEGIMPF